jgi:hypothetical protein
VEFAPKQLFLDDCDFIEMAKIVTKHEIDFNFGRKKLCGNQQ